MTDRTGQRSNGPGLWRFLIVVAFVLFVLAFVTFNLGLFVSFTIKRVFWGGLTTAQVWVSGVILSTLLYGVIYVQLSGSPTGNWYSFSGRLRRSFRFYMGLNTVAFVTELIVFYGYGSKYLREFFTAVFPVLST